MATQGKKISKPARQQSPAPRPRPGLGRGLGALLGASAEETPSEAAVKAAAAPVSEPEALPAALQDAPPGSGSIIQVLVGQIARSPWQPRHVFEATALQELAESIKAHGVIQPLLCRRAPGGDTGYELIAGERRFRAAIDAGLAEVPVILVDAPDRQAAEMAIIENIQREDLNVIEEAEGYRSLAEHFGLTQQEVADRVGKVWGLGSDTTKDPGPWEGEQRNMWKPTMQEGLWFHGGNLHQSRHYSLYLALQLKARMEGLDTPVYGLQPVHHLS